MKYAFIRAHREEFGVRAMCRALRVHFSGFYAWIKEPLSHRAKEDARQTELIRQAWTDSGKVYGYRKLTDDLRDQGEEISENRVARLASLAGIAAHRAFGPGLPVHQPRMAVLPPPAWTRAQHEPARELPRQRRRRELLPAAEAGAYPWIFRPALGNPKVRRVIAKAQGSAMVR